VTWIVTDSHGAFLGSYDTESAAIEASRSVRRSYVHRGVTHEVRVARLASEVPSRVAPLTPPAVNQPISDGMDSGQQPVIEYADGAPGPGNARLTPAPREIRR
jgi:hypothetical protein